MTDPSRDIFRELHKDQGFYIQYVAGIARRYQELHGHLLSEIRNEGFELALKKAEQAVKNAQVSIEELQGWLDDIPPFEDEPE